MKNKKQKILVLSELDKFTSATIKSSISLAKIVDSEIDFFYVKKPTEVVEKESQLSAMRTINKEYNTTDKKIKKLINGFSEKYNVPINHTFKIGNVKNEINTIINQIKPDIIVLGQRKSKLLNFMGDNITQFVIDKFKGTILISNLTNSLEPNNELSFGLFNTTKIDSPLTKNILSTSEIPLKFFNIEESSKELQEHPFLKNKKTVEYVFSKGDDTIKNISNYLLKSNINLLFINREEKNTKSTNLALKDVINKLDCSLILTI